MDLLKLLADPGQVAKLQRFCGIEYEKPATCDQQTQTRGEFSDSDTTDSNSEQDKNLLKGLKVDNTNMEFSTTSTLEQGIGDKTGDYGKSQSWHRIIPNSNLEERNNNVNKAISNLCQIDDDNDRIQKEKTWYEINEFLQTKSYHVIEPSSRAYNKDIIYECSQHSAGVNSKSTDHDSVSRNSEISTAPPPNPKIHIKYKSLLYLAHFGAFLGNEEFYLTFFPFCVWNLDSSLFRKVAMLWCIVMYLGQATKDYLRWPRPPWPPVMKLETHYSQEFSMPSTHAMAGTAIPFCLAYFVVERYQVPITVVITVALLWFTVTCWSRLYLGVHTILDLLAGFVYALLILLTFLGYVDDCDLYQQTHPFAVPVLLFTSLALCTICYPSNIKNSSKGDAVQIVAALTGVGIGGWLGYHLGFLHESEVSQPFSIITPTLSWCGMALLRFATGAAVLAVLYAVTRWLSIRFYSYMYGLDRPDKTFPAVMTAYKFTTYTVVGTGITLFAPLAHLYLGIHRPALFFEVL